jgi:hypothetical protein
MILIKLIGKVFAVPILIVTILVQWISIFLNAMTAGIFYLLSSIFFLTGVLSYGFGLETKAEVVRILIIAFAAFIVPFVVGWLTEKVILLRCLLAEFIRS